MRCAVVGVALLMVLCTSAPPADASLATEPPARITIPRVARPPQLADFVSMSDPDASLGMHRIDDGFVQRFPSDGHPASKRTIVFLGYDHRFFYVAFQCFDDEPSRIGAHLLQRDAFPNDEDTVAVHVDTFRDLKHAYGFQANSYGVQTDGIYTEGSGWDLSWDTVWRSDAERTSMGYVVLFAIPFKSLRFPSTDLQQWGIFLYRSVGRTGESVFWPACSTSVATRFPHAAVIDFEARVSPGRNVQAAPYFASRSFKALEASSNGAAFMTRPADMALGADVKAVVRDSLVLDGTINPDFSQVESDLPQITVNKPFEVFFPEKRPFFLENAAYFATPIQLLFTRRIADPLIGGRASGRTGPYAVGAMVVDDRAPADTTDGTRAWLGAVHVTRDVGESSVGVFASERTVAGLTNSVGALDTRVRLGSNWFAVGQAVLSDTTALSASHVGSATRASLIGSGRRFNYELDYNDRSPAFRAADGFIPRIDVRSVDESFSLRARPRTGALQAWGPDLVLNRTWDFSGRPLDYAVTPRFAWQWTGSTILDGYYTVAHQALRPSEVPSVARVVDTVVDRTGVDFQSAIWPRVIGSATFFVGDAANLTPVDGAVPPQGRVADASASATVRLSSSLMLDTSYLFDRLSDVRTRATVYTNRIYRVRLGEQFTTALALRVIIQYNQVASDAAATTLQSTRNVNYDVLFTYLTSPGTAIYVGANDNMANLDPALETTPLGLRRSPTLTNTGWQVFVKTSYVFRW